MFSILYAFNGLFEFGFCNILYSLLNMCHGIMLPLLPIFILYGTIIMLLPACISNSTVNIDQILFICTESILTVSILPLLNSWDVSTSISFTALLLLLWHTFLKCPDLPYPAHIFPHSGHCLSGCTLPQYWHAMPSKLTKLELWQCLPLPFLILLFDQIASTLLVYLTLLPTPFVPPLFLPKPVHPNLWYDHHC